MPVRTDCGIRRRRWRWRWLLAVGAVAALWVGDVRSQPAADLLLVGGLVHDGSGQPPVRQDVGVVGERISFVGDAAAVGLDAAVVVDVDGLMVTPGFIDMHSHAALTEDYGRDALPFLHQGITTVAIGVDGAGTPDVAKLLAGLEGRIGVNAFAYAGHGEIRRRVIGEDDRAPTAAELDEMRALVRRAMREGAFGLSTGLFYVPGYYATTGEVIELARVAAAFDGIYDTHDRDLGASYRGVGYLASIREAIRIGEAAGLRVIFSHFNAQGASNYGRAPEGARLIEEARARGVEVAAAQHVYTATQSSLAAYTIPRWASNGGREEMLERFRDPETARRLDVETMEMLAIRGGAEKLLFADPRPELNGRTLAAVAAGWELPVPAAVRRILTAGNAAVMNLDLYDIENTRYLARQPWMMTCTDGRTPSPAQNVTHPRVFGAFTRKLRQFVLDEQSITMPFAIRSMTGLAADFLRLNDRGYLRAGAAADIAVFDRDRIRDLATYDRPRQPAEGTVHVLVNGRFAIRDGEATGALAGRPLRRTARTAEIEAQVRDSAPVTDAMLQDPDPADWLSWRRTLDGWGYSPLDEIDRSNVDELRLAWSWGLEPGVSQTTPLVHDGVMYVANPGNVVQALDARTGDFLWEYRREMDEQRRAAAQMRSLAVYQDLVILNTVDAHIVGLDVRTGEVRWDTPVGGGQEGYTFSNGPIVAGGTVVAGLTGCGRYRDDTCYVVGVDGRTGRLLWRTSTIARPGESGGDTWGDLPLLFRAGADAWMTGSYDPVTGLIYWGTSQPKPHNRDARGTDGDALYSNSTLALDPATGEMRWYYQHIPGDSHDMDESFERILIDYDGRRSLFTMGKLGILWELDRVTGAFRRALDLGYQNILDVDPRTGAVTHRDGMLSDVGEELFFCPSTGGFKSLRAMAYHPGTGALYVPLNLSCETAAFAPVERRAGGGGGGAVRGRVNHFHPQAPGQLGEFRALDVRTGETLWRRRLRVPYNTAALTTGGGLVFIGDWGRRVHAYDVRTGEPLWRSRLATMANGFPITYAVGGRQFVAFVAGPSIGASSWATILPGDLLPEERNPRGGSGVFVFALP